MDIGCICQHNVGPPLEDGIRDMQLPLYLAQEGHFVGIDLGTAEA